MTNRLKWNENVKDWKWNRRVVEDVPAWIGWDRLLDYYHKCPTDLHKQIFVALFETGGRVSEVLELQPSQFIWNDEAIKVERMTVLKYRKRMRRGGGVPVTNSPHICARHVMMQNSLTFKRRKSCGKMLDARAQSL